MRFVLGLELRKGGMRTDEMGIWFEEVLVGAWRRFAADDGTKGGAGGERALFP